MKKTWTKISTLGINSKEKNTLFSRTVILCNQLNVGLLLCMVILLVFLKIMSIIDNKPQDITILRATLVSIVTITNLFLAYKKRFLLSKINLIFSPVIFFIILPTLVGFIQDESFTYYPFVIIGLSIIPQLILHPDNDRKLFRYTIFIFFILTISIDSILKYFLKYPMVIVDEIDKFYPYYKSSHVIIFIFTYLSVYYLRRINVDYEDELNKVNAHLVFQSENLKDKNVELKTNEGNLIKKNQELQRFQKEINKQNEELKKAFEDLKNMQQKLVQSEKMASLGILTAGVAHEINNPLNYIAGGAEILHSELKEIFSVLKILDSNNNWEEMIVSTEEGIKMIEKGVSKATNIVNSLNLYSFGGDSHKTISNVNEIINSAITFLYSMDLQEIHFNNKFNIKEEIYFYPDKLHQVLLNILDNAIFSLKTTKNLLKKEISITTFRENNLAIISIKNSGPKIDSMISDKIFDPFFTTKDPNEGTGLGLSISYNLIKEHQGEILLNNEEGAVEFVIKIPFITQMA